MNKLITTLALAAAFCGCATKSRSVDIGGMWLSETGQLAVGKVRVDAIPEGSESAVIHYTEDTALLSPSKKTHDIDVILTGTNSVGSASNIVSSICQAFVAVAPKIAETNANAPKGVTVLDVAKANAAANAEVKKVKAASDDYEHEWRFKNQSGKAGVSPASDCPDCVDPDCTDCTDPAPDSPTPSSN